MINYRTQKGGMEGNIFILVIQVFRIKNKQKHVLHIKWKMVLKVMVHN